MTSVPAWLPSLDHNIAGSIISDGLAHLPTDVLKAAPGLLAGAEPTTLVLGSVIGTLAEEKTVEYARELDHSLHEYIDEHPEDNAVAVRIATGVSHLLPDGEELNQAAIQAARGNPDALRKKLQEYHEDEQLRADVNNAVKRILTGDFDDIEGTLSDAFDTDDTNAAQALLFDFIEIIRTQQTRQTLKTVLDIDAQFDTLSGDLDKMREKLEHNIRQGLIDVELRDEGFQRLSPLTFDRDIDDPERAWRAGFDFIHVREGFAVDRTHSDGTNVTTDLFDTLRSAEAGTSRLLCGPAGSGKSTIGKTVACRWYDTPETGPVFYRESGRGGRDFESVGKLEKAVCNSNGHALVVVEDAVRPATDSIYDVIEEVRQTDVAVSFLLDARQGEFEGFKGPSRWETGAEDKLLEIFGSINRYDVPALDPDDPTECQRIAERFEVKTGKQVSHSPEYIHGEVVQSDAELGDMLYLTYFLPVGGEEATGLESDVRAKYLTVIDPAEEKSQRVDLTEYDNDLFRDVALLANLLNASRIGIHPDLVHALGHIHGNDRATHREIQQIREALGDWMLYPQLAEASAVKQTTHELWSALYLREVARRYKKVGDEGFERGAKERFKDCINVLFRLPDDQNLRRTIRRGIAKPHMLDTFDDEAETRMDKLVEKIFNLGERWPVLAPLYGTIEESEIMLPEGCSNEIDRYSRTIRGHIHLSNGDYQEASKAYEMALEMSKEFGHRVGIAEALDNLGLVARRQGNYETAWKHHEESLELKKNIGDHAAIARSLNNLGLVAEAQGDYDTAQKYFEESLTKAQEVNERATIGRSLSGLGVLALRQNNYDIARKHFEDSLNIAEELSDRSDIANCLGNLGVVIRQQGDYETSWQYHQDSLSLKEEIGHRSGIATSLCNLGLVAQKKDDYDTAERYHDKALTIQKELGERGAIANSLNHIGKVAEAQGDYEAAREHYEESLEIYNKLDDCAGIANSIDNLGFLAVTQGDYEAACDNLERSTQMFIDMGILGRALSVVDILVLVYDELGQTDQAIEWCETALELIEDNNISEVENDEETFRDHLARLSSSSSER